MRFFTDQICMDIMAYTGCNKEDADSFKYLFLAYKHIGFKYILYWRLSQHKGVLSYFAKVKKKRIGKKYGVEIGPTVKIGGGFKIIHPWGITFNSKVSVGNNVTVLKGVTLGNQKRGVYEGAPVIGNNVYIGLNSTIVGGITIGDNVLIAPNSFVNRNVEGNTIVLGNPMQCHPSNNSTEEYLPIINY